ncbi:hypothetical protein TNIN_213911 [Trichonephila inaurata madagascariensis]|uniref:Uncharacterized protein n=1 Tax=Trichonephila inaurata madagascariensis TaxID=2747483 RepID=A0A8X7CK85_9ARAC|nr:hypothetical protein TNIN_213911 [Trichonephila inaurata madagascariensis]
MPKATITPQPARKPRVPAAQTTAMDTDLPPPTDQEICDELKTIQGKLMILQSQITLTEKTLVRIHHGRITKTQPRYDDLMKKLT